jgi:hypothetical protein
MKWGTSIKLHGIEDDHLGDIHPGQVNSVTDYYDKISGEK